MAVASAGTYASPYLAPDITMPAPQHSGYYRPDALPDAQPTASKHRRGSTVLHCYALVVRYYLKSSSYSYQKMKMDKTGQKIKRQKINSDYRYT